MKLRITVHGVSYEVDVEVLDPGPGFPMSALPAPVAAAPVAAAPAAYAPPAPTTLGAVPAGAQAGIAAPIAGIIKELKCKAGDPVTAGQTLVVIEAMKMLTNITSASSGRVKSVLVAPGDNVREGQVLVELE